jgi:hypothetical protein
MMIIGFTSTPFQLTLKVLLPLFKLHRSYRLHLLLLLLRIHGRKPVSETGQVLISLITAQLHKKRGKITDSAPTKGETSKNKVKHNAETTGEDIPGCEPNSNTPLIFSDQLIDTVVPFEI